MDVLCHSNRIGCDRERGIDAAACGEEGRIDNIEIFDIVCPVIAI